MAFGGLSHISLNEFVHRTLLAGSQNTKSSILGFATIQLSLDFVWDSVVLLRLVPLCDVV